MTLNVELGQPFEDFVAKLVRRGSFKSDSAVLQEGLRLLQDRESKLATLDIALEQGVAAAEAGDVLPLEEVRNRRRAAGDKLISR